jgi:DNA modification methylase
MTAPTRARVSNKNPEAKALPTVALTAVDGETAAVWVPRTQLLPWSENPRKNSAAVDKVVASIKRFGFGNPILARQADNEVIAGHTRLLAAEKLGLEFVPVRFMDLDPADAHMMALADNKLGEISEWDDEMLSRQVAEMDAADAELLGFDEKDRKRLEDIVTKLDPVDGVDSEDIELPPEPVSVPGEVYELGPHRLVCGDSTSADSWALLLGDERVDLVWTDPPYGVSYVGKTKDALTIENDALSPENLRVFLDDVFAMLLAHSKPGAAWYVAAPAGPLFGVFGNALEAIGVWKHTLVWVKQQFVMGRCDYHYRHEAIFYGWEPNGPHYWCGARNLDTILEFDRPKRSTQHPTMKPPELIQHCIKNSSREGALVVDAFGGSGSTLIAAAKEGRRARLIELSPQYCDVIRKRWGEFARSAGVDPGPGAL